MTSGTASAGGGRARRPGWAGLVVEASRAECAALAQPDEPARGAVADLPFSSGAGSRGQPAGPRSSDRRCRADLRRFARRLHRPRSRNASWCAACRRGWRPTIRTPRRWTRSPCRGHRRSRRGRRRTACAGARSISARARCGPAGHRGRTGAAPVCQPRRAEAVALMTPAGQRFHPNPDQRRCLWTPPRAEPLEPITLESDSRLRLWWGSRGQRHRAGFRASPERFSFPRLPCGLPTSTGGTGRLPPLLLRKSDLGVQIPSDRRQRMRGLTCARRLRILARSHSTSAPAAPRPDLAPPSSASRSAAARCRSVCPSARASPASRRAAPARASRPACRHRTARLAVLQVAHAERSEQRIARPLQQPQPDRQAKRCPVQQFRPGIQLEMSDHAVVAVDVGGRGKRRSCRCRPRPMS